MNNQAIYRLPGESVIHFINNDLKADDSFIIRPFDRKADPIIIKGKIQTTDPVQVSEFIDSWLLPELTEVAESDYLSLVKKSVEAIKNGDFYKVVPARQKTVMSETRLSELFLDLVRSFPDAFVYVFNADGFVMTGASPETLIVKDGAKLKTEALGGTMTHGKYSEKEIKEHEQITAYISGILERNSYSFERLETRARVAGPVEHLCTEFRLDSGGMVKDLELIEQLHPTPAVCGMPFDTSFNFIEKNEEMNRGFYSGYIGQMTADSNFKLFVNLRCAEVFNGAYRLFAGAGINEMSDPEDEFLETENKMKTIAQRLK